MKAKPSQFSAATRSALKSVLNITDSERLLSAITTTASPTGTEIVGDYYQALTTGSYTNFGNLAAKSGNKIKKSNSGAWVVDANGIEPLYNNIFSQATQHLGYTIPRSGVGFFASVDRDCSDWIDITGLTHIRVMTTDDKLVCAGIQFYPADKSGSGVTVGSFTTYAAEYTAAVPANVKYAVLLIRRNVAGEVLPYHGDTLVALPIGVGADNELTGFRINGESYNPAESNFVYQRQSTKLLAEYDLWALKNSLLSKKVTVMGSSNATDFYGTWASDVIAHFGLIATRRAIGGATYVLLSEGGNSLVKQVEDDLVAAIVPDLILFSSGMNDVGVSIMGDFSVVKTKTLAQIRASNDVSFGINTFYGAVFYCIQKMQETYADAQIIVIIPFQTAEQFSVNFETNRIALKDVATYCSVPIIDAFSEGGINGEFDAVGQSGRYYVDGVHTKLDTVINAKGQAVQKNYLTKQIALKYCSKV